MNKDVKQILTRHLELDAFYTGDFSIRGPQSPAPLPHFADHKPMKNAAQNQQSILSPDIVISQSPTDTTLEKIAEEVRQCRKCPLAETRTHAVPGQGHPQARLVFVGEGPGEDEDAQGLAFVGRAGKKLTEIINAMGLSRDEVFICNVVKCRPPGNRDPKPDEIKQCIPYLKYQLEIIAPAVIVALGAHAAHTLLETDTPIGKLRGRFFDYAYSQKAVPAKLMPTYHPAYLLRNYTLETRRRVWEDMQKVVKELDLRPGKS